MLIFFVRDSDKGLVRELLAHHVRLASMKHLSHEEGVEFRVWDRPSSSARASVLRALEKIRVPYPSLRERQGIASAGFLSFFRLAPSISSFLAAWAGGILAPM